MSKWNFNREAMFRDLQNEFDRVVDRLWHGGINTPPLDGQDWAPILELVDESDRFVITAEVPGITADEIDLSVAEKSVTLSGTKPAVQRPAEHRCVRSERRFGTFRRTIDLPEPVDDTRVEATCAHGVLTVSLPKQHVQQGRKVHVETTE